MWHQWFNRNVMRLWENFFVCKENKNNDFTPQFLLFHVSLRHVFMRVPRHMHVMLLLMQELTFWHRTQKCCGLFTSRGRCTMYIKQSSSTCLKILTERMTCNFLPSFTYSNQNMQTMKSAASHTCIMIFLWKCIEDWHRREEIVE